MKEATPDTKPLDLVALRELANETKDLAFGAVVSRLLDRIEELEKDLGLERIIRKSAQDTAKRLGNAIDAHEGAAGSCHFPWHQHDVKAFPSHLSPTDVVGQFRRGMRL